MLSLSGRSKHLAKLFLTIEEQIEAAQKVGTALARKKKSALAGKGTYTEHDERVRNRAKELLRFFKADNRHLAWCRYYEQQYPIHLQKGHGADWAHLAAVKDTFYEEQGGKFHSGSPRSMDTIKRVLREWSVLNKDKTS